MTEPQPIARAAIRPRTITEIETMPEYTNNGTAFDDSDTAALASVTAEIEEFMSRPWCECCGVKRVYVHPEHGQHYLCKSCSDEQTAIADSMWT